MHIWKNFTTKKLFSSLSLWLDKKFKFFTNGYKAISKSNAFLKYMMIFIILLITSLVILFFYIPPAADTVNKISALGSLGSATGAFFASMVAIYLALHEVEEKIEILIFKKKFQHDCFFLRLQNKSQLQISLTHFEIRDKNNALIYSLMETTAPTYVKIGNCLYYEQKIDSFSLTNEFHISNTKIVDKQCKIFVKTSSGNEFQKYIPENL